MLAPPAPGQRVPRQLVLDLPVREAQALEDFLPAPCNRAALEAVLAWPRWPGPVLCLVGPEGCGKSHLAAVWAARAQPVTVRPCDLVSPSAALERLGAARAALWDEACEPADERGLLHLINALAERSGHLLLVGRLPPTRWVLTLPDLRSRLAAAPIAEIAPPDDALLAALLVKQLRDRNLSLAPSLVEYLIARMERSFAGLRRLVRALDRAALATRRPLGPGLARMVLDELQALRESEAARAETA